MWDHRDGWEWISAFTYQSSSQPQRSHRTDRRMYFYSVDSQWSPQVIPQLEWWFLCTYKYVPQANISHDSIIKLVTHFRTWIQELTPSSYPHIGGQKGQIFSLVIINTIELSPSWFIFLVCQYKNLGLLMRKERVID